MLGVRGGVCRFGVVVWIGVLGLERGDGGVEGMGFFSGRRGHRRVRWVTGVRMCVKVMSVMSVMRVTRVTRVDEGAEERGEGEEGRERWSPQQYEQKRERVLGMK